MGCELAFDVAEPSLLALQIAPATTAGRLIEEQLEIADGGGLSISPSALVSADHGGRIHLVAADPGMLSIKYVAAVLPDPASPLPPSPDPGDSVASLEAIIALRQSRAPCNT